MNDKRLAAFHKSSLAVVSFSCIVLLVFGTMAQATDSCEFAKIRACRSQQFAAHNPLHSAPGSCLICVAASSPPLPAPAALVMVAPAAIAMPFPAFARFISKTATFQLYVRPPPAL
jgi:hypothetical protein